jgi:hypothetical protein
MARSTYGDPNVSLHHPPAPNALVRVQHIHLPEAQPLVATFHEYSGHHAFAYPELSILAPIAIDFVLHARRDREAVLTM